LVSVLVFLQRSKVQPLLCFKQDSKLLVSAGRGPKFCLGLGLDLERIEWSESEEFDFGLHLKGLIS